MQKLNEDFLDAIQNDTQQDTVDVAGNGVGDKADYPITVSLGPTANLIIDDTPETIREHIIRVLEQTPQVVSYSRIEVNLEDGNSFRSGIYVRKMGNYDGYLVEYENEDPVIFGLKT